MKVYPLPYKIKIRFGTETATLPTATERITTPLGVVLKMEKKPAGEWQPIAVIPDGTLEMYKHTRPQVLSCEWV